MKIRRGNIRRATLDVAQGFSGKIRYRKTILGQTDTRRIIPVRGTYNIATHTIGIATHEPWPRAGVTKKNPVGYPDTPRTVADIARTAGHELAHSLGFHEHDIAQEAKGRRLAAKILRQARRLTRQDRSYRKSSGGGDVQVSAHEREGRPVAAYTRSRPS